MRQAARRLRASAFRVPHRRAMYWARASPSPQEEHCLNRRILVRKPQSVAVGNSPAPKGAPEFGRPPPSTPQPGVKWSIRPIFGLPFGALGESALPLLGFGRLGQHARRSEEHTSELQSLRHLVCRLLLEK